jgi:hypothetical protein
MEQRDLNTYLAIFDSLSKFMQKPDVIVHLDVQPAESLRRIQARDRDCEKGITLEYLTALRDAYEEFLTDLGTKHCLSLDQSAGLPWDGRPDLVIKTSPEFVIDTAIRLAVHPGAKCVALCSCGVVHVFLPDCGPETVRDLARPLEADLHAIGGDWSSRHVVLNTRAAPEDEWISTLRHGWQLL